MEISEFYIKVLKIPSPYTHQIEIWKKLETNQLPLLLRAPTGSGKTEAVLAPFLNQFIERDFPFAPRLIYTLPMRAQVNSVAERIQNYANRLNLDVSVGIQHGDSPNSPFFISDIVVATLDQFLYGFARASKQVGYHVDIPAGAIASSLVVFDEAHMYRDGFTFSIMRALMEILSASNVPFVVMTATMPKSLEESLFENINDYQTISVDDFDLGNSATISLRTEPLYTKEEVNIDDELFEKIKNKKTLIVLNQVERAQKVYEKIKKKLDADEDKSHEIVLLHSRFTRTDRNNHENTTLKIMESEKKTPRIVISTQVLEAGMDFSAELLLTELAPADSIVQRAGRCARYEKETGEIIIFPVEGGKGHLPYEDKALEKTRSWLQKHRNLNIKNFREVCSFVDILDEYEANDYEAIDTLIDLFECVLYADQAPENIQLREGKPVTLVVVDLTKGIAAKGGEENQVRKAVEETNINEDSITVDIRTAWKYFSKPLNFIKWELRWSYDDKNRKHSLNVQNLFRSKKDTEEEDIRIRPFGIYILGSHNYDFIRGIVTDAAYFIESE